MARVVVKKLLCEGGVVFGHEKLIRSKERVVMNYDGIALAVGLA